MASKVRWRKEIISRQRRFSLDSRLRGNDDRIRLKAGGLVKITASPRLCMGHRHRQARKARRAGFGMPPVARLPSTLIPDPPSGRRDMQFDASYGWVGAGPLVVWFTLADGGTVCQRAGVSGGL